MKTAIISPSGNLYGSEQVLIDYLAQTKNNYTVYVPKSSVLESELHQLNTHHTIRSFNSKILQLFYLKIFVLLLFGLIKKVYWNEGGHIRYAKVLANIFRNKIFYAHIRIIEDTKVERLGHIPANLKLLTISDYMNDLISSNYNVTKIYDPFILQVKDTIRKLSEGNIRIGIVGRITTTKGLGYLNNLLLKLEKENNHSYEFHFFGDPVNEDEEVIKLNIIASRNIIKINFHGFVNNMDSIYNNIDILLHLSTQEPLGRIIFETISYNLPYIVFNKGGTGEISTKLGLEELAVNLDNKTDYITNVYELLNRISKNYGYYVKLILTNKIKLKKYYAIEEYVQKMDLHLQ